jgi:hypothetical protein
MSDPAVPGGRPAIRIASGHPPSALILTANRQGYAVLAEACSRVAQADGDEARAVGQTISASIVADGEYIVMECAVDEALGHPVPARVRPRWRAEVLDAAGLAGCAGLVLLAGLAAILFVRGAVAFWHDIQ